MGGGGEETRRGAGGGERGTVETRFEETRDAMDLALLLSERASERTNKHKAINKPMTFETFSWKPIHLPTLTSTRQVNRSLSL